MWGFGSPNNSAIWGRRCFSTRSLICAASPMAAITGASAQPPPLPRSSAHFAPLYPSLGAMLRRYGSAQVRNAATIGGNIANGSPIGDGPPALIAMGATLHLRHGDTRRSLPLEDFFIDYGKQDRAHGEFVEAITVPKLPTAKMTPCAATRSANVSIRTSRRCAAVSTLPERAT